MVKINRPLLLIGHYYWCHHHYYWCHSHYYCLTTLHGHTCSPAVRVWCKGLGSVVWCAASLYCCYPHYCRCYLLYYWWHPPYYCLTTLHGHTCSPVVWVRCGGLSSAVWCTPSFYCCYHHYYWCHHHYYWCHPHYYWCHPHDSCLKTLLDNTAWPHLFPCRVGAVWGPQLSMVVCGFLLLLLPSLLLVPPSLLLVPPSLLLVLPSLLLLDTTAWPHLLSLIEGASWGPRIS
jgi:hypothetical protein